VVARPHGHALRLTRRPALAPGQKIPHRPVISQPDSRRLGVREREAATGDVLRPVGLARAVAPAVVGSIVGRSWRDVGRVPESGHHQHGNACQTDEVNPCDHQHELSLARHR
jgi:hypothetical protein